MQSLNEEGKQINVTNKFAFIALVTPPTIVYCRSTLLKPTTQKGDIEISFTRHVGRK